MKCKIGDLINKAIKEMELDHKHETVTFDVTVKDIKDVDILAYTTLGYRKIPTVVITSASEEEYYFYQKEVVERLTFTCKVEHDKHVLVCKHVHTIKKGDVVHITTIRSVNATGKVMLTAPSRVMDVSKNTYHLAIGISGVKIPQNAMFVKEGFAEEKNSSIEEWKEANK